MARLVTAVSGRQASVAIIGAGFAGLRAADVLIQKGFRVTIFEARNRLGGRVAQSEHLGHLVDLGPNWIHGTVDNPIMRIAQETGTRLHGWDEGSCIFDSDGKALSDEEAEELNGLLWDDGAIADAIKYSREQYSSIDPEESLYDFFVEKAACLFADQEPDVAKRKRENFLQFALQWGSYVGSPVTRQSLRFFWLEECIEGETPFVSETYHKILEAVAKPAKLGADIRLNSAVVKIMSAGEDDDNKRPSITLVDGSTHTFDEIIVTVPLGWLKKNKAAFEPELPPRLTQAIDSIGYGTLDKVYITFPTAFWEEDAPRQDPSDSTTAGMITTSTVPTTSGLDPHNTASNPTAKTAALHHPSPANHDSNTSDNIDEPPKKLKRSQAGFTHFLQPSYARDTNAQAWMQDMMNLSALPGASAAPTLLFYISGPQSMHIGELLSTTPSTSSSQPHPLLAAHFAPYISLLPRYSAANPSCTPTAIVASAWVNDEFAGNGSYSNFQIGLRNGDQDILTMRQGLPERHVWFAGEHTAPFVALGTTTGAYVSGEAVAGRIAERYGREGEV